MAQSFPTYPSATKTTLLAEFKADGMDSSQLEVLEKAAKVKQTDS